MKPILLSSLLLFVLSTALAQRSSPSDEEAIKKTVNQFFEALEKHDTTLYKDAVFVEGQVWNLRHGGEVRYSNRFFKDFIDIFDLETIFQEKALSFEIKIHKGLAMAWVPYEFRVNGKFSHCGLDVFTLLNISGRWRITNMVYTVEQDCEGRDK